MRLLFAPGTCSLGIHLLLEEIGKPYETQRVTKFRCARRRSPSTVTARRSIPKHGLISPTVRPMLWQRPRMRRCCSKATISRKLTCDHTSEER
jgi:hypothetical protein